MHAGYFGLKRAYYGSLKVTRKKLADMGLTAARFDLLYLLAERPEQPRSQAKLIRILGVTPPVVSRMLKSLRERGLVERTRHDRDRRKWLVTLTTSGRALIRRAMDLFILCKRGWRRFERGLCPDLAPGRERADTAFWLMCDLEYLLDTLRRGFDAGGTLYYPWHPDD